MIKLEKKQGIATVTLNRVEKQNALSFTDRKSTRLNSSHVF